MHVTVFKRKLMIEKIGISDIDIKCRKGAIKIDLFIYLGKKTYKKSDIIPAT